MKKSRPRYYAVARGRKRGIYTAWDGPGGAWEQVRGFPGALYRKFDSLDDARRFIEEASPGNRRTETKSISSGGGPDGSGSQDGVLVYTDGGCIDNPGPGGWAAVIIRGGSRTELSGGFRLTTNNRMELTACIQGLRALGTGEERVTVFSDSRYIVDAVEKGWARRWRERGWMRDSTHIALNHDLWAELLDIIENRDVRFVWVRGHAGNRENERCDELAREAAKRPDLPPDHGYESGICALNTPTR